jgi:hypothetical protein
VDHHVWVISLKEPAMDWIQIRQERALDGAIVCLTMSAAMAFMLSMGGCSPSASASSPMSVIAVGAGNVVAVDVRLRD